MNNQLFFEALLDLRRSYVGEMDFIVNNYQLSSAQWFIFKTIAQTAPTTLVEVAKARTIEKPTATKIIQKLVELNLIQSSEGRDKREKILSLTEHGQSMYQEIQQQVSTCQQESLANISVPVEELTAQLNMVTQYYQNRKEERFGRTY
ncbi:MarR family winged helix-turn-helix transcriptional regulator [Macrococcus equipercicus]|uniref:Winged helix DNA-binding protein n=1 Tax=Macrococcus equipercicus TaxID=69967 RepID=A0A9Q9BLX4_9STAP|nr:MarR family transcriptional regulator [Macrococcus equipercicus]KAA1039637.1 winged helix DNA-binding protein [Macrococcus equipercicus]UTH13968.1 winged helix DNA-binding protein [Macrococcus equipercicus]